MNDIQLIDWVSARLPLSIEEVTYDENTTPVKVLRDADNNQVEPPVHMNQLWAVMERNNLLISRGHTEQFARHLANLHEEMETPNDKTNLEVSQSHGVLAEALTQECFAYDIAIEEQAEWKSKITTKL